jgi:pimeloyl-ACP methyl ester carboxylesterase
MKHLEAVEHSEEKTIHANGIEIVYDTFGAPSDPAMLLIMGLGEQLIAWDEELCRQLAGKGYWVIRFDNRDVGLSTKFDEAGVPDLLALTQGAASEVPYTLEDMAEDAVGLLEGLGVEAAHVVGVSMGGMIAQTIAINHPQRVLTLTSIMSSTSDPRLPPPKPEAGLLLYAPSPTDRAGYIEYSVKTWRVLGGPCFPINEERIREFAGRVYDRGRHPAGFARQLAAILASGSRKSPLKSVHAPTLVIHGDADPLIPVEAGKDTAETIAGAKLVIIEGMGHDLPPAIWPEIVTVITDHAAQNG